MAVPLNLDRYPTRTVEEIALALAADRPEPRSPYGLLVHAIDHLQATPTPGYSMATRVLSLALRGVSAQMDLDHLVAELQSGR
jgi:hypothetical protein